MCSADSANVTVIDVNVVYVAGAVKPEQQKPFAFFKYAFWLDGGYSDYMLLKPASNCSR